MDYSHFQFLLAQFSRLEAKADAYLKKGALMAATLDDLVTKVTAQKAVIDSAVALLVGLKAKLDAALANGDPVKIQQASDALDAQAKELADAVAANTPAQ